MNIFVLHRDPTIAATMACDKHVVKMIVETAQMLCTVAWKQDVPAHYRATHQNHPCTRWAGESQANWDWLIKYGLSLCAEYTKRYSKIHKSQRVIEECAGLALRFRHQKQTPFAQAMPPQYRNECVVDAYRAYYHGEKSGFATWKTHKPDWWVSA